MCEDQIIGAYPPPKKPTGISTIDFFAARIQFPKIVDSLAMYAISCLEKNSTPKVGEIEHKLTVFNMELLKVEEAEPSIKRFHAKWTKALVLYIDQYKKVN